MQPSLFMPLLQLLCDIANKDKGYALTFPTCWQHTNTWTLSVEDSSLMLFNITSRLGLMSLYTMSTILTTFTGVPGLQDSDCGHSSVGRVPMTPSAVVPVETPDGIAATCLGLKHSNTSCTIFKGNLHLNFCHFILDKKVDLKKKAC